jgi:heme exporter protein C
MLAALYLIFCVAPTEATMGDVQRIFYFHVPCWWVTYGGFFTVAIASAIYLWTGSRRPIGWRSLGRVASFLHLRALTGPLGAPILGFW